MLPGTQLGGAVWPVRGSVSARRTVTRSSAVTKGTTGFSAKAAGSIWRVIINGSTSQLRFGIGRAEEPGSGGGAGLDFGEGSEELAEVSVGLGEFADAVGDRAW